MRRRYPTSQEARPTASDGAASTPARTLSAKFLRDSASLALSQSTTSLLLSLGFAATGWPAMGLAAVALAIVGGMIGLRNVALWGGGRRA